MRADAEARTRAACHALAAHEQDLFLAFAALLRIARGAGGAEDGAGAGTADAATATDEGEHTVLHVRASGDEDGHHPPHSQRREGRRRDRPGQQYPEAPGRAKPEEAEEAKDNKIMRSLCDVIAGWLVHPLGPACAAAREAAGAFLWYLVAEDAGYRWGLGCVDIWCRCPLELMRWA
jgi:hypothetical protein